MSPVRSGDTPGGAVRAPAIPTDILRAPCAWHGGDLKPETWRIEVGPAAAAELAALSERLADYRGPVEDLGPEAFELPAVARMMAEARARLDHGVGFALIDRLPIEGLEERTARALCWLVVAHLGPIINQKHKGVRLYDVRDTNIAMAHGVRRSITNLAQEAHTDGAWLALPPEAIALACVRQAASGGASRIVSLVAAHNEMLTRHPDLLRYLYDTFFWDRQAEHPKDEARCSRHPIFAWDGARLTVRYYDDYVRQGHRLAEEPLREGAEMALAALRRIVDTPERGLEFALEPGQIELVNNRLLAHARCAFQETGDDAGRLLLRVWVRWSGGTELEPSPAAAPWN